MKLIKQGLQISSPYYGNGYVVRTLALAPANETSSKYIVVRCVPSKSIVFFRYPEAINRLLFLDASFDNMHTCSTDMELHELVSEYHPDRTYVRTELSWYENGEIERINEERRLRREQEKLREMKIREELAREEMLQRQIQQNKEIEAERWKNTLSAIYENTYNNRD